MGEFIRFYSWGLSMKFHMAVYTLALVFFKAIFNALAGEGSVSSLTMLQMLLVSMAVAILESFLFPEGRELEPSALRVRTVWWGLLCNLGFVGGALALGWFSNVPLWGGIFLVLFLEWGLSAMWFGLHVALRRDTRSLNRKLSEYQKRGRRVREKRGRIPSWGDIRPLFLDPVPLILGKARPEGAALLQPLLIGGQVEDQALVLVHIGSGTVRPLGPVPPSTDRRPSHRSRTEPPFCRPDGPPVR